MEYLLGIDVGTASARVGLFDLAGQMISHSVESIKIWKPEKDYAEQSSEDIWKSICACTKKVLKDSGIKPEFIKGIGFDATCSLVAIDSNGFPISVNKEGDCNRNIIMWMDHRAIEETEFINQFKDDYSIFKSLGGVISPEMQMPKLLWLKNHLPDSFLNASDFFDLPDFLTYRATGSKIRSLCSLTCKWTYQRNPKLSHENGWDKDFLLAIGLDDLYQDNASKIGHSAEPIGKPIDGGLSEKSANELGLIKGTPVGVSIIDAHAGGVGMIGLSNSKDDIDFNKRLALIGGTSSCHMAVSEDQRFINGVWGPYFSAMVPGLWLNEGGQSATGSLVDHTIQNHFAYIELKNISEESKVSVYEVLNNKLDDLSKSLDCPIDYLTKDFHVCPYFHGNRSPRANPKLVGMISGLKLSNSLNDLAIIYLSTIQSIAYGTRHIIEEMNKKGYDIDSLICCGGGTKNELFLKQHANITNCLIILPKEEESVLLGSAMLGGVASGIYKDLKSAMKSMSHFGRSIEASTEMNDYHQDKYKVFHELYNDQIKYKNIMDS